MAKLKKLGSQSSVKPSSAAQKQIADAVPRIEHIAAAVLLWNQVLTVGERKRLGDKIQQAYAECGGTIGIWLTLRRGCRENAIIEINYHLGLINGTTRDWLRREFGLSGAAATPECHLEWCNETGELRLNDEVIRKIRRGVTNNVDVFLDAFQGDGWPQRIDDPLPRPRDVDASVRLRETVRSLNRGLQQIRFAADGRGEGITWEIIPTK